jgi:predicted SAM-dependent methyltransferase
MIEAEGQLATVQRVRGALRRIPAAHTVGVLARQGMGLVRRSRQLDRYFRELPPQKRCLFIGCGPMTVDRWLCTDLVPVKASIVYLDATKHWPMPSASFHYVVCEHMIEHVPYDAGLRVLNEAHRVLLPRGVLRISTPNLDVIRLLPDRNDSDVQEYVRWSNQTFGSPMERTEPDSPVHALNRLMRAWGHTYLYDEATLRKALTAAGFPHIVCCEPGQSQHAELIGVDRHATLIGESANRLESLILEATA